MGKLLDQYLQNFGPQLEQAAQGQPGMPPQATPPGPQGPGAQTFPMQGPGAQSSQPLEFGAPSFQSPEQMGQFQPGQSFETAPQTQLQAAPAPSFEQPEAPELSQVPTQPRSRKGKGKSIEDVKTFDDLMGAADEKQYAAAIDMVEQQSGGPEGMDAAYAQVTGSPPDDRLTREEKGELLLEFGLRMLSHNAEGQGDWLGPAGRAGAETLGSARQMRQAKREAPAAAAAAEQKSRLTEAQIAREEREPTEVKTDSEGNMILINTQTGQTTAITHADGSPVTGEADTQRFEKEVAKDMYMQVECVGLEGSALKACTRRAVAFAAGARDIAFPELMRADHVDRVMKILEDPDNERSRYTVNGEVIRWRDATQDQKDEIALDMVDQRIRIFEAGGPGTTAPVREEKPAPTGWEQFNLTEGDARTIPQGSAATLSTGQRIANIGGKLVEVDANGRMINQE